MLNPPEIKTKRYERKLALREGDVKKKGRGERLPLRCGVLRCNFVRNVEQVDRPIHVGRLPEIDADPAALGKDVVGFGAASRHQLIRTFFGKGISTKLSPCTCPISRLSK